ncbi:LuxR C-terminal-related transcriptional regulator [Winslowiella sp. 2C04]|uniref:helix-turn-helix transcriptional regulator n=1 Tax=Winslowiella sp. 2C04 TaxID=3416179 RepID=UPI003CFAB9CF
MYHTHTSTRAVALMDSQPLTLSGLSSLIKSIDSGCDIRVKETCLEKISEALMYHSVDILVTDLQSAQENLHQGLDILLNLSEQFPRLDIVVYTLCHNGNELRKLVNQRNISLIARGESLSDTEDYFRQAFARKRVLSPRICCDLVRLTEQNIKVSARITRSETEVLRHLFNGMDLREIAQAKQLSIKTISAHKCNAMRKLGVKTDSELFLMLKNIC